MVTYVLKEHWFELYGFFQSESTPAVNDTLLNGEQLLVSILGWQSVMVAVTEYTSCVGEWHGLKGVLSGG